MTHELPWQTLIGVARKDTDTAAQTLGHAVAKHAEAQTQLDMLLKYRDEYQGTLGTHSQNGLSIDSLKNHRGFIERLESIILQQHEIVAKAKQHIVSCQKQWQQRFCKLKSFDTLAQRQTRIDMRHLAKREQGLLDEHSALHFRRHRHE
jgi:flagellar FliJ protein